MQTRRRLSQTAGPNNSKAAIQRLITLKDSIGGEGNQPGRVIYRDRDISVHIWQVEPGKSHLDIHKHPYSAHVYMILEGRGKVLLGKGKWKVIREGQVLVNPRNKAHAIRNASANKKLVWLSVTATGGGSFSAIPCNENDE